MFLKSLIISTTTKVIREISFHKGINLIVDESEEQSLNEKMKKRNSAGSGVPFSVIGEVSFRL